MVLRSEMSHHLGIRSPYVRTRRTGDIEYDELVEFAESGIADAQIKLANMLSTQNIGANYYEEAAFWYRKSIKNAKTSRERADALYGLALLYKEGNGVKRSKRRSRTLFKKALKQYRKTSEWDNYALNRLGLMYYYGEGVERSLDEAKSLLERSSDMGNIEAKINLSAIYSVGYGVDQSLETAILLLKESYGKADKSSNVHQIGPMTRTPISNTIGYKVRKKTKGRKYTYQSEPSRMDRGPASGVLNDRAPDDVAYDITGPTLDTVPTQSQSINDSGVLGLIIKQSGTPDYLPFDELIRNANSGKVRSQYELGMCYYDGKNGATKSIEDAKKWLMMAANKGCPDAQYQLGVMYENGIGVDMDLREALIWYKRACVNKHKLANHKLNLISLNSRAETSY